MNVRLLVLSALACLLTTPVHADDIYRLDSRNTKVTFVGSKKDGKHEGGFNELKGMVTIKDNNPATAQFKVDIDLASMFTDNDKLTDHLKGTDFFNVRKFPIAKFISSKVEKKGDLYEVTGKLTMNGNTKEIVIPAKLDVAGPGLSLESNFEINRHDWKISYGAKMIDEKVKLTLSVMAAK